jgi:hypothetical protein
MLDAQIFQAKKRNTTVTLWRIENKYNGLDETLTQASQTTVAKGQSR